MKCHAGVEYPSGQPCPKCGAKLGEVCWPGINQDLQDVQKMRKVMQFIIEGYWRIDISHEDFRVQVYKAAWECAGASTEARLAYLSGDRKS